MFKNTPGIGMAIMKLSTDKRKRPICDVVRAAILDEPGSEKWLEIVLSTGTILHFSPDVVDVIVAEKSRRSLVPAD